MKNSTDIQKSVSTNPEKPLKISIMQEDDVSFYCAMFKRIFEQHPWNETWTIDKINLSIRNAMSKNGFIGYVAKYGSEPVGYLTGYRILIVPALFYIDQLFVNDSNQGNGIGKALFSNIHHIVRSSGYHGIILLTKADSPAYRFYIRNGFKLLFPIIRFKGKVILYLPVFK